MTAWEVPDGELFKHPDLPHRSFHKVCNNEAWHNVLVLNEQMEMLLLRASMPAIVIKRPRELDVEKS